MLQRECDRQAGRIGSEMRRHRRLDDVVTAVRSSLRWAVGRAVLEGAVGLNNLSFLMSVTSEFDDDLLSCSSLLYIHTDLNMSPPSPHTIPLYLLPTPLPTSPYATPGRLGLGREPRADQPDPRDLDTLLGELTLINARAELYLRFIRRRVAVSGCTLC